MLVIAQLVDVKIKAGVQDVIGYHLPGKFEIDGGVGSGILLDEFVVNMAFITYDKTFGIGRQVSGIGIALIEETGQVKVRIARGAYVGTQVLLVCTIALMIADGGGSKPGDKSCAWIVNIM